MHLLHRHHGEPMSSRDLLWSFRLLWWVPLSPFVGFALGSALLAETWPLWQVIPLTLVLAAPFFAGAFYGLRAVLEGDHRGWIPFGIHVVMAGIALVVPIVESLAN